MSARPPIRKALRTTPLGEQRAVAPVDHKRGSLGWVRDVLSRSIGLEQRRKLLPPGPVDHRRTAAAEQPPALLLQQRAELGARLLVHDPATQTVRNLFLVHDELGRGGWPAVSAMPRPLMDKALAEAEMLAIQEASPLLTTIIEQLRDLGVAADMRAEHAALKRGWEKPAIPEVSEATHEEYDLMERSWIGTIPAELESPTAVTHRGG
ncbi:MAG: hypothetical protein M3Z29_07835 [Pseudomonadota bacterium]|nr:hypothetical protein [Pseudomonadota bacterium]